MSTLILISITLLLPPSHADRDARKLPVAGEVTGNEEITDLRQEHARLQTDYSRLEHDMESCRRELTRLRNQLRDAEDAERQATPKRRDTRRATDDEAASARNRTLLSTRARLRQQEGLHDDLIRQREALYREIKDLETRLCRVAGVTDEAPSS